MRYFDSKSWRRFRSLRRIGFLCCVLAAMAISTSAWAGGGPENLFLVINPRSPSSMTIANYYIQLRQIPAGNVFYLPWDPNNDTVSVDAFRTTFIDQIFGAIHGRHLEGQIDYVIYSSDYPTKVDLDSDFNKFKNPTVAFKIIGVPRQIPVPALSAPTSKEWKTAVESAKAIGVSPDCSPVGSLNGMTYLWQWVKQGSPDYITWQCNMYMRKAVDEQKDQPSLGFRSSLKFGHEGELVENNGPSYMLSAMLGVTSGRGNTVAEVLKYLGRSAKADGTHPKGTIFFMRNDDIRSAVRDNLFPEAVKDLEKLGIDAKIVTGTVPINRANVQGLCMGIADFDWQASNSEILPGALCEHFTSYGGVLAKNAGQTPLTEFLRYGAAGASGTVTEPHATWQKFPIPTIQVHYGRGCTLAEAFYQSVFGPYQLLIVGDPLCRPWANIPHVDVAGIKNSQVVKGELVLTPTAKVPRGGSVDRFELFVNGVRAGLCKNGETLKLDTKLLPDGVQELRVVAVENSVIQSQGRAIFSIVTDNFGRKIEIRKSPHEPIKAGEKFKIEAKSPDSIGIGIVHNGRLVGRIAGEEGTVEISADELGSGKVQLQAVGIGKSGSLSHVKSASIDVEIEEKNK